VRFEHRFDLPIAIGLLAIAELVPSAALDGLWAVGELEMGCQPPG
jgi:predicted ATPase with chaperone activity